MKVLLITHQSKGTDCNIPDSYTIETDLRGFGSRLEDLELEDLKLIYKLIGEVLQEKGGAV